MKREPRAGEGRPLAYKTEQELQKAIDHYFANDAFIDMPTKDGEDPAKMYAPTMAGLALSLGVDRKTIVNYSHKEEYFLAIKKARAKVEIALEQRLYAPQCTGVIFNLKNNFDWRDKQELDHGIQEENPLTTLLQQISGKTLEPK